MAKILEVKKVKVSFRTPSGILKAVRDISFDLERGETLAIVGESGSGKSVTSKAILGILAGNSIVESGEILYDGRDLLKIPEAEMHKIRGDKISMIFQDPLSSLNPIVKIGKQITEAMLLKNKVNRREARAEFNAMLEILKVHMTAANPTSAEQIKTLITTFDEFNIVAIKLENHYNMACGEAETLIEEIKDLLFRNEKNQKIDVKAQTKEFYVRLKQIRDPFLTRGYDAHLEELGEVILQERAAWQKAKESKLSESFIAHLTSVQNLLTEILSTEEKPNFFRIGFYQLKNPQEDLSHYSIPELNAMALEYLDSNFMGTFIRLETEGIKHSFNEALEKKKALLAELESAKIFYAGDFEKKEALKLTAELSDHVEASIDRLEIVKDSTAYTFRSSLNYAVEKYFYYQVFTPKEEARFEKQTRKREALIARGKKIDWQVVPKSIVEPEELKENIIAILDRLIARYTAYIAAAEEVDFAARAIGVIDHLKEKASQVVYRVTKRMAKEKAIRLMEEVGIAEPRLRFYQYPFEFSGGMRQRIVIAIALAANPDILICDEPTTALDVTIQAQILELINRLKKERNLSVIFITHDLGVVANMADKIAVMYAGKIVEYGTADDIFYDPRHPYTWALLSSMPDLDTSEKLDAIPGTPPNLVYPPVGDAFADRNKYALKIDFEKQPPMFPISETHSAATWLLHPDAPEIEIPKVITDRIARMKKAGGEDDGKQS